MEANELRIGNYINKFGIDYECDTPVADRYDVQAVSVTIDVLKDIDNYNGTTDHPYYEEIPITEEWLLRFGFEFDEYDDFDFGFMSIRKDEDGYFYYNPISEYYDSMKIILKYVHELQNLYFALTRRELKIN